MAVKISSWKFVKEIQKYEIIVLGEIHGTREIPNHVRNIIASIKPETVFFELPQLSENTLLDFFRKNRDGRASKEYFILINYLKSKNVNIDYIESANAGNKDQNMFDNIMQKHQNHSIVICGNIHASYQRNPFTHQDTLGTLLKQKFGNKVVNVNVLPLKGTYYNFGVKKMLPKKYSPGVYKNFEEGFDYTCFIANSSPCSFIK